MKASETFRHPVYRHNCAQCIVYKWNKLFENNAQFIEASQGYGVGRAPEGMCGALYAAINALPNHKDEILSDFKAKNGALTCKELKQELGVPCPTCVDVADELIEKYSNE